MIINISISSTGEIKADVEGGVGPVCITNLLAELEGLVGEASETKLKPEYEMDVEVAAILRGVTT